MRPQDLVFTLFGEFLLHRPGRVWVGSLIRLLAPLGVSASNVRTVLSRMVGSGWLESEREGRRSYYRLTARGRRLLEEGEARIYHPPRDAVWEGEWTLISYSVPEERRAQRDRLRVRLAWLGYGSLGNGLWISPHDTRDRVREAAAELGVEEYLEVFRGRHDGFSEPARLVARCWDLDTLNARYDAFIGRHLSECVRLNEGGTAAVTPADGYLRRMQLVHEYREFPLVDPFLPRALQPSGWAGECALALFQFYHDLLTAPAEAFVASLVETSERAAAGAAG